MLESIGIIAIIVVAYLIYENYSRSQYISPEQENLFRSFSDAYSDISVAFRSGSIDRATFEERKRQILNNPEENRTVAQRSEWQNEAELERKEKHKKMRIVGYKYDEFIFKIFDDRYELTADELLEGIRMTFNLPDLSRDEREEYYLDEQAPADEEILNIWLDNSLIEKCDWSMWSEENPWNMEHFKVGKILRDKHLQINDYDITYDVWLEDRNITLKHNKYYDIYMAEKS